MLEGLEAEWRDRSGAFAGALAEADPPAAEACAAAWSQANGALGNLQGDADGSAVEAL